METPRGPVLRKMFKAMDTDGDGSIDEREGLAIGRVLAGDTAGAVQFWEQLRKGADSDGDGVVSLDEYLQYSRAQTASRNPEEVSRGLEEHLQRLQESRVAAGGPLQETQLQVLLAQSVPQTLLAEELSEVCEAPPPQRPHATEHQVRVVASPQQNHRAAVAAAARPAPARGPGPAAEGSRGLASRRPRAI